MSNPSIKVGADVTGPQAAIDQLGRTGASAQEAVEKATKKARSHRAEGAMVGADDVVARSPGAAGGTQNVAVTLYNPQGQQIAPIVNARINTGAPVPTGARR